MSLPTMNNLFHYVVVRYVPDPARGEFRNVGIVVEDRKGGRKYKIRPSEGLPVGFSCLDTVWDHVCMDYPLGSLFANHNGVIQFSRELPMLCNTLDTALERMYNRLVAGSPFEFAGSN